MVLALAVLLMQPLAAPAVELPALPIQSAHFSSIMLSPAPIPTSTTVNAPAATNEDKDANAQDAAKQAPSTATTGANQGGFSSSASYMPGQFELTRVSPSANDSDLESSSLPAPGAGAGAGAPVLLVNPVGHKPAELAGRGLPKMWFVLGAVEHGSATFDAWSTRRNISEGLVEMNPMLKPFANSGAIYAAVQVAPVAFDFLGKAMLHSSHPMVRRMWWVPQTGSTVASVLSGAHNMAIH